MTDPFYMLMLMRNLGNGFVVRDASAKIKYIQPGRGKVTALFLISEERVSEIKRKLTNCEQLLENFQADVINSHGEKIASVVKSLHVCKNVDYAKYSCQAEYHNW